MSFITISLFAEIPTIINLKKANLNRGLPVMEALSVRASSSNFSSKKLNLQDLSDLLWAANGINRPDEGKRTAPSAINAQDIDIYAVFEEGIYLYNPKENTMNLVAEGDFRKDVAAQQDKMANAPVFLVLVSDISKFTRGDDAQKMIWASEDAGIVSQNINIFCAAVNFRTRTRASMDIPKLRKSLKLRDTQFPILNNPVSY